MDGQTALWEAAAATLGNNSPRAEIVDLLHTTGHLWEAAYLLHDPGSAMTLKWMKVLTLDSLAANAPTNRIQPACLISSARKRITRRRCFQSCRFRDQFRPFLKQPE